jgi:glycosyltransferase involved in cell wall biosynthesis
MKSLMKILFLSKRLLFPTDRGGLVRTLNVVRHLAEWHEVTFLCSQQPGQERDCLEMSRLGVRLETVPWIEVSRSDWRFYRDLAWNLFSSDPFNAAKDYDPAFRARVKQLSDETRPDVLVCDFVQMARNAIGVWGGPSVLFEHNVEAEIFERHAQTDEGWIRRRFMGYQAAKMRRFEGWAGREFTRVVAVSERDRDQYRQRYGWTHVDVIDTAVDIDYYRPVECEKQAGSVVFVGSLDWLPNVDGLQWFVTESWPLVMRAEPQARLRLVGRNPPPEIKRLGEYPGVEVVGSVPDTRPWLTESEVSIVPLRIGGGTRLKVFEAMAMGLPVVSTPLGAEGLQVRSEEHLLLAEGAEQVAQAVLRLLRSPELRVALGRAARNLVTTSFSSESVARQFEAVCQRAVEECRGK